MKVLVSAYACEPHSGSEPGIGWNWVRQIARRHDAWVVTRAANREAIERSGLAPDRVTWIYYDLPRWLAWWKRGTRGVRLYYQLWQIGAARAVRRHAGGTTFDVAHHVTFGTYWLPSCLALLHVPYVWGPVGGGESAPHAFYGRLGWRGAAFERLRDALRRVSEWNPAMRRTCRRARVAVATTRETAERLARLGVSDARIISHVGLPRDEITLLARTPVRSGDPVRFASIGRLLPWKGYHLGIAAFARVAPELPGTEYWIIGSGPDRARLAALARTLGVADRVRFLGALARTETLARLADCDVLVHPSLHDSGGYACAEAMAAGRPVIALDLGGPALVVTPDAGFLVPARSSEQAIGDIAGLMRRLADDPALRRRLSDASRARAAHALDWDRKGDALADLYAAALLRPGDVAHHSARLPAVH